MASPHFIGARTITSELIRPAVVSVLDVMLRDRDEGLRIEEVLIPASSPTAGATVGELRVDEVSDALLRCSGSPMGSAATTRRRITRWRGTAS